MQFLACKGWCILEFCVMSWKGESEPSIKYCLGRTAKLVQRFTTIQNFGHNRRRADGIRVEYFPGFTTLQPHRQSSRVHEQNGRPITIPKDELSSCRCSMTSFGDLQTMNGNALLTPTLVTLFAKSFPAGRWSFLGPGSEKKWYSTYRVAELMMIELRESGHPVFRATSLLSRGTLESKGGGNYQYTSVPMALRLKLFFAQLFLLISSVSTEQSQICVMNSACQARTERPALAGQADPLVEPARLLITTPTPSIEITAQENVLPKVQRTSGYALTTRPIDQDLYWCRIPDNSWSRTVHHDKRHWRVLTICRTSDMSWVHVATRWKINWPERLASREYQNWARVISHNQLLAR